MNWHFSALREPRFRSRTNYLATKILWVDDVWRLYSSNQESSKSFGSSTKRAPRHGIRAALSCYEHLHRFNCWRHHLQKELEAHRNLLGASFERNKASRAASSPRCQRICARPCAGSPWEKFLLLPVQSQMISPPPFSTRNDFLLTALLPMTFLCMNITR